MSLLTWAVRQRKPPDHCFDDFHRGRAHLGRGAVCVELGACSGAADSGTVRYSILLHI